MGSSNLPLTPRHSSNVGVYRWTSPDPADGGPSLQIVRHTSHSLEIDWEETIVFRKEKNGLSLSPLFTNSKS